MNLTDTWMCQRSAHFKFIPYTHTHTHARTHARTHTHTRAPHARTHAHTPFGCANVVHISNSFRTHTHTHARTHAHTHTHTHTHSRAARTHAHTHTPFEDREPTGLNMDFVLNLFNKDIALEKPTSPECPYQQNWPSESRARCVH